MKQFSLEKYLQDPTRKVVTRDGLPVRIVCTDVKSPKPIVACVECYDPRYEDVKRYYSDGTCTCATAEDTLFFAPQKQSMWIFLYVDKSYGRAECIQRSGLLGTKEEAEEQMKILNGFALTEITWEE